MRGVVWWREPGIQREKGRSLEVGRGFSSVFGLGIALVC